MALAAGGDWGALERLLVRYEASLFGFFYRLGGDPTACAELVQAVMTRLYLERGRYDPSRPFAPWVYGIAKNVWNDHLRRRARSRTDLVGDSLQDAPSPAPSPAENLEQLEDADHVRRAVQRLPEDQRLVVVLRHWQGLTYEEIAAALQVPLGTVKWRLHEALTKLGRWLGAARGQEALR